MDDHPVMLSAYVFSNLVVVACSLIMAFVVLPRLRIRLNWTVLAAMSFFVLNAAQHLIVTYGLLFTEDLARVATSWQLLAVRIATAVALAAFVAGIFIDIGRWRNLQRTMARRPPH